MAKDPAFLFYPNDWIGGTMGMTLEQKGAYMELLMMQFNRGHMTTHMISQTVGQLWDDVKDKFVQDNDGRWYNERLEEEKIKRQNFTNSRRNNVSGKNQHLKNDKKEKKEQGHMTNHTSKRMEDEDVNENKDKDEIVIYPFDSENFKKWWGIWKEYKKKEHGFKYKSHISEQAASKELANLSNGNESTALKIIERSISKGWKGFFPLENNKNQELEDYAEELKQRLKS